MKRIVTNLIGKIGDHITDDVVEYFLEYVFSTCEENIAVHVSKEKALEGTNDEKMKYDTLSIADAFIEEMNSSAEVFTEEELKERFEKFYASIVTEQQYAYMQNTDKEELWKRFLIFARKYLTKYNQSISLGEKRILEISRKTNEKINHIMENGLSKERFEEIAEQQSQLLEKLCEDRDVPLIDIGLQMGVDIQGFEPQYVFLGNTFDFDETPDRAEEGVEHGVHVMSFCVKNIGHTNIYQISIDNMIVNYVTRALEDIEGSERILPVVRHENNLCSCKINILPNGEQIIHIIFKDSMLDISNEETCESFLDEYDEYGYNRLFVKFDIGVTGMTQKRVYKYMLCVTEDGETRDSRIDGEYRIDFAGFSVGEE